MTPSQRWLRRTAGAGLAALAAVLLCALGAVAFLATPTGRDTVAWLAEDALSDDDMTVRITRLAGNLLSDFRIGAVRATDAAGNAIVVEDVRVRWRPVALLGGTLDIASLQIRRIAVDDVVAGATPERAPSEPFNLPPLSARVGELTVRDIALGPAVLGEPQRLSLSASAALDNGLAHAMLRARLTRRDDVPGHADITIDYAARPARFAARLDIDEPAGGPIARLAGLPQGTPLLVTLDGVGPPGGWRGTLVAQAGSLAEMTTDLTVSVRDAGLALSLDGAASLAALLPEAARPFAAPRIGLHALLDYGTDGSLTVKEFKADSGALSVEVTGRYGVSTGAVDATLFAALRDARALSSVAPAVRVDGARLEATLGGSFARPALEGRFDASGLSADPVKAAAVSGEVRLAPSAGNARALRGMVRITGFDVKDVLPAGLLGPIVELRFDGNVLPDGTIPSLHGRSRYGAAKARLALKMASGAATVDVTGSVSAEGAIEGRYALRHVDIAAVAKDSGLPLRGRLQAAGDFLTRLAGGESRLGITGSLDDLASDAPWLTGAIGRKVDFSAGLQWDGSDRLRVTNLDAKSDAAQVRGSATVNLVSGTLDARYAVSAADLRPFSPLAGVPLAGTLSLTGSATGQMTAPAVSGRLALRNLSVQDTAVGNVMATINGRPQASGIDATVRLDGDVGGKALDGAAALSMRGATVRVSRLDLALGANGLAGDLTITTEGPRLEGAVTATIGDLADLPAIAGLPPGTAGKGSVRLRLRHDPTRQIDIAADFIDLATGAAESGALSIAHATATGVVRNPFETLAFDGTLGISDATAAGASVEKAELRAQGTLAALDWTVTGTARQPAPLSLSASGSLSVAGQQGTVTLRKLDGKVEAHAISLRAPATVGWSPQGVKIDSVDLSVAGGRVRLSADQRPASIDARGEVTDLPVALLAPLDPMLALDGSLSGRLRITGSPRRPLIDGALTAAGVRPPDVAKQEFAGLTVTADLRQSGKDVHIRLMAKGPEDTAARAEIRTAPVVSLSPLRLSLPAGQTVAGQLDATARLALVERIVGLGGDRLAGRVTARARLAGTLTQPDLRGEVALTEGAYEGAATGIVLRNAAARLAFTGGEARLVSLSATDGNGGRISGSGTVAFAGPSSGTGDLSVRLDRFAALRRPEADITASGTLALKGPLDEPSIQGNLTVDRGEIRIPDRLPEDVVELEVVEINGPKAPAPNGRTEPSVARALAVGLDITVGFPGMTFVRGRGLESEWKGDLRVAGTSDAPKITGKLSVVRGTFAFAGKSFALKSGSVSFFGRDPPEPEIDAVAEARLETVLARVQITGKTSKPAIKVTSEPPLPQEEVLSRILFGRSTGQLSAIQAARLAHTAATLSGATGGAGIVDKVRQTLGVDVLDVDAAGDSGRGASLKAGKYISEDVFVSVSQGTEPGSQKVGVEVEVLPNLSVESDVSGSASGNVGVNWKFDY